MINVVHVIMGVERIDAKAAKSVAYAWQLHTESAIRDELEELRMRHDLGCKDWKFIEACMLATSGSLFSAIVMSRYGGEDARVM